ncbi:hypothetical protein ABW21_db0208789 [Orbilia brochopaga]|nr:hypothetical protein ABW21_db0208789 [Drechslerella brochopaga]
MATPNSSNASPNLDDNNIAWHLLVETAIFDSTGYDLLSHEELDQLKKEQPILVGRIDALRRKLLLETKVRDAARSLSRLHSPPHNAPPEFFSSTSLPGPSSLTSPDPTAPANAELNASVARCEEINADINNLDSRLRNIQLRLLRHTAGVLAATHHNNKLRYRNSGDGAVPASSYHIFASKFVNPPLKQPAPEDFDHRSLYRPSNSLGEFQTIQPDSAAGSSPFAFPSNTQSYQSESINDATNTQTISLSANGRLTGQPETQENRDLFLINGKLADLNAMLEGMLSELGQPLVTPYSDHNRQASESIRGSSDHTSGKRIDSLEQGLARLRAAVLGSRSSANSSLRNDPKSLQEDLSPIWDILFEYEAYIRREETGRQGQQLDPPAIELSSESDSRTEIEGRSIEHLESKIRLLTERALRLAKEQLHLREQLSQLSLQKQLEMQKNEDAKTSHEQQILGLTNSLSNTLNELSQVSSHQDSNALQLKQEVSKLKSELTENEILHKTQLEELQTDLAAQREEFDGFSNAALRAAQDHEHAVVEQLRLKNEEFDQVIKALEIHRSEAKDMAMKLGEQQQMIDSLRDEINRSQADASQSESQSLIGKKRLEDLGEKLKGRETQILELERSLGDLTESYNAISAQYEEQSRIIETLQITVEDLQDKLEENRIHAAEQKSACEGVKTQLGESKASQATLEAEVKRLTAEVEHLSADLETTRAKYRQQDQLAEGKPQAALDASLMVELEKLSKQNQELMETNTELQTKLADMKVSEEASGSAECRNLENKYDSLQKELKGMLFDYEALMKSSVDFEAERLRLETQVDSLQDKLETAESSLADERIRWLGGGSAARTPTTQANGATTPAAASSGEAMTMAVLRAEFKKMIRDMRTEHSKALKVSVKLIELYL